MRTSWAIPSLALRGTRASLAEIGGFRPLRGAIAALKRTDAGSDRSKPAGKTGKGRILTSGCGRKCTVQFPPCRQHRSARCRWQRARRRRLRSPRQGPQGQVRAGTRELRRKSRKWALHRSRHLAPRGFMPAALAADYAGFIKVWAKRPFFLDRRCRHDTGVRTTNPIQVGGVADFSEQCDDHCRDTLQMCLARMAAAVSAAIFATKRRVNLPAGTADSKPMGLRGHRHRNPGRRTELRPLRFNLRISTQLRSGPGALLLMGKSTGRMRPSLPATITITQVGRAFRPLSSPRSNSRAYR